jgi:hypothetical protein
MRDYTANFDGTTPDWLLGTFTNPDFLTEWAKEVKVTDHTASVEAGEATSRITMRWRFPTDRAPGIVRRALPPEVTMDWVKVWDTATRSSDFEARSGKPEFKFVGHSSITGTDAGVTWQVSGHGNAKHPRLIPGSVVDQLLDKLFLRVLNAQTVVAQQWLAAGR